MKGEPTTLKRAVAGSAAAALAIVGAIALGAPAQAHGGMTYPADRAYQCYLNGYEGGAAIGQGGNMVPTNPVCIDAIAEGTYSFYTWYGNLLPQVAGKHEETIPDGSLCGPNPNFTAYNAVSEHWPTTSLESGQDLTLKYAAKAPHPGWWFTYITKETWDPTQPLGWDDLDLIDKRLDPPLVPGGVQGPEYTWTVSLPERTGQHIIYEVWERTDSPEAFYTCSDVVFGEGGSTDGGTTDGGTTDGGTTDGSDGTHGDHGTTEGTTDGGSTDGQPLACTASYVTHGNWGSGFQGGIVVKANQPLSSWNIRFDLGNSATVANLWGGQVSGTGPYSVSSETWNGSLATGQEATLGFIGNGAAPASLDITCS